MKERNVYDFAKEPGSRAESIYVPDPLLIRRHRAGYRGRFTHPEYGGELVEINDDGYRDGAWPASMPAGETRILILGDSNVFGHGLEANETISARLQADYRGRTARSLGSRNPPSAS